MGHAGELLQGALRLRGAAEPFLITLPAPGLVCRAGAAPAEDWSVHPAGCVKALRAARLAAERWGWTGAASVTLTRSIPVGRGFGSSTADCTAAARAMAALAGVVCGADALARIVAEAEGACDSTMFELEPVVFLPERGECLERLDGAWPSLVATVFDLGGPAVDTVAEPRPEYASAELDAFEALLEQARAAFRRRELSGLGRVASASAEIHRRHRPNAGWETLLRREDVRRAEGVAAAHTGTIATVLSQKALAGGASFAVGETEKGGGDAHTVCRRR